MAHDLKISARAEKSPIKTQNTFQIQGGSKLEVFDENGKLLHSGEFQSFTSNFLKLLYGSMIGAGTAKAKDLSNSDVEMNALPQAWMNLQGGSGVKKFGVVVGTNTAAVSVSDYSITVPASLTVNDTAVSASSVGADSISVEISRQIGNLTGSTVNLKEAGLICGSEDEVDSNVLIARDLLNITLESGKKSVWRYTINFNFANDKGGFVQSFANKMFNGIFEEVTSSAAWSGRVNSCAVVFDDKIWVMGGDDGSLKNDVWYSSDGITWSQATASAAWSGRRSFRALTFDDKIWIMGGNDGSKKNDVWYSSDGITWIQATASAAWSARSDFATCVFADKMWVMGGYANTNMNDVWYSSDGITWSQATASAAWSPRFNPSCISSSDKIWIMGGNDGSLKNDVWYSSDGITWSQATSAAGWSARDAAASVVFDDKIWLFGGRADTNKNDVWYSSDGITWIQATASAAWSARVNSCAVVFDDKIWVMGGTGRKNDVYSTKLLTAEIIPGSHNATDTPFSATATALGALIANGSGSGELIYGAMPSAATIEPFVSGNKTKMSIAREFTNNSGANITVREVGLFSGADMLARLILATPVTILNGQSDVITVDFETEV